MNQTRMFLSVTLKLFILTLTLLTLTTLVGVLVTLAVVVGTLLALIGIPIFVGIVVPLLALIMQRSDDIDLDVKSGILEQSSRSIEELKEAYSDGRISREEFERRTTQKLRDRESNTREDITVNKE